MYTKYNYTYKSMLFVLYSYTCMYTKYVYTYKSMFLVYVNIFNNEIIHIFINDSVPDL